MLLGKRSLLDRPVLEDSGIADRYACDGWFPSTVRLEWTDLWCCSMQFAHNDTDLVVIP